MNNGSLILNLPKTFRAFAKMPKRKLDDVGDLQLKIASVKTQR